MGEKQMQDDVVFVEFMSELLKIGVVMVAGSRPDLARSANLSAKLVMLRVVERLARLREARRTGLM
jgi:hypothetical protein